MRKRKIMYTDRRTQLIFQIHKKEVKIHVKIIAESLLLQIYKILSSVLYNRVVRFAFTEVAIIETVVDHRFCTAVLCAVFGNCCSNRG
jgi:hypothetical protein